MFTTTQQEKKKPLMARNYNQQDQGTKYQKPLDPIMLQYPSNNQIKVPSVRLIDDNGENLGVIDIRQAQYKANQSGLDLVLISPGAKPPVAKILDYSKFIFEQKKNKKEAEKNSRASMVITKEVQLRPVTEQHDVDIKVSHAKQWLSENHKVKIVIKFRGRELSFSQIGFDLITNFINNVGLCKIEKNPEMNGNSIIALLAPEKVKPTTLVKTEV